MSFKLYTGEYLAQHGYPVLIVTSPIKTGDKLSSECHSFFSGNPNTYSLINCEYDLDDIDSIDEELVIDVVKKEGEKLIYDHLANISPIQYQAFLAGIGYKIIEKDKKYLIELHMRNFLLYDIEKNINDNTGDEDLKDYLKIVARFGRIRTVKKI